MYVSKEANGDRLNLKTISQKRFEDRNCPVNKSQLISGRFKSPECMEIILVVKEIK